MKPQHFIYCIAIVAVLFTACKKNDDGQPQNELPQVKKELFSGYAQKGPFVNGSSITVVELNDNLEQTGKTYSTTITDNSGSFELNNMELVSRYVELKADGFYFNEVAGKISVASITLYALADIEDVNSVNVNVLTHLEKPRVEYLVKQGRMDFAAAKQQAQQEVLAIFGFEPQEISFEALDLTIDAKLLAISCILQGTLSTGDMMELMADINTDMKQDGTLDNTALGEKLRKNAISISLSAATIRNNLTKKYAELDAKVTIPDFESYIELFVNSGLYPLAGTITYPTAGFYDNQNILSDQITEVRFHDTQYNFHRYYVVADVPEGLGVRIVLKGGEWNLIGGWYRTEYDAVNKIQELITTGGGETYTGEIYFFDGALEADGQKYITIEYYENGAITAPTKTKKMLFIPAEQ